MKILVLITARGGSKRVPGKNIRRLGDKPLVVWSIDAAKGISNICDIFVSTDDVAIAKVCSEAGAFVPWIRPKELSSDTSSSVDVALHALDWYEAHNGKVDGLLLLQPTSPFRSKNNILRGIELFCLYKFKPVIGVSLTHNHPMWTMKKKGDYLVPFMSEHGFGKRSQDLPSAFIVNGSFYLISPEDLRTNHSFIGVNTIPLVIESPQEALDIDTEWDFKMAEYFIEHKNRS
jgi:CMP-N,N'-diacetyllegionaminic acid synthase